MINTKAELANFVNDLIDSRKLWEIEDYNLMLDILKEVVNQTPLPDIDKIYQVVQRRHQ